MKNGFGIAMLAFISSYAWLRNYRTQPEGRRLLGANVRQICLILAIASAAFGVYAVLKYGVSFD